MVSRRGELRFDFETRGTNKTEGNEADSEGEGKKDQRLTLKLDADKKGGEKFGLLRYNQISSETLATICGREGTGGKYHLTREREAHKVLTKGGTGFFQILP